MYLLQYFIESVVSKQLFEKVDFNSDRSYYGNGNAYQPTGENSIFIISLYSLDLQQRKVCS